MSFLKNFKLWSTNSRTAKEELHPNFDYIKLSELPAEKKQILWKHLKPILFAKQTDHFRFEQDIYLHSLTQASVFRLNNNNKRESYGQNLLNQTSHGNTKFSEDNESAARADFHRIFLNESDNVFLELLSYYYHGFLKNLQEYYKINTHKISEEETDEELIERRNTIISDKFKEQMEEINDIFSQFSLPYKLSFQGFIPKQETIIENNLVDPVLRMLADNKWKPVNQLLRDAFESYHKNTPKGFSESITNSIAALEAFLQIKIFNKQGKQSLGGLVQTAIGEKVIPDDNFSKAVINQLVAFLARERKETGTAHPKKEYATEKNSRLLINLTLLFIQHSS